MRRGRVVTALVAAVAVVAVGGTAARTTGRAASAQEQPAPEAEPVAAAREVTDLGPDLLDGKPVPLDLGNAPETTTPRPGAMRPPQRRQAAAAPAPPGSATVRSWPSYDTRDGLYLKEYTRRAIGDGVEVWVATGGDAVSTGLAFPGSDCRNGARTSVTDAQVAHLVREFEETILPTSADVFSAAPPRSGAAAALEATLGDGYYAGDGERTVILVDNVRDDNFYDPDNAQRHTYVAGFFSSQIGDYTDRNVITLDAFDWLHRTTGSPPNQPTTEPCTNAPARPWFVEGILAHEYQHLLHDRTDGDETLWLNEGLSDVAQVLTGYLDPRTPVTQPGYDSHVQCLLGHLATATDANPLPREASGPENSLTRWEDQGPREVLCDYGAASTFLLHLRGRFGDDVLTALHVDPAQGLASLQDQLDATSPGTTVAQVVRDWAATLAVDAQVDLGSGLRYGALALAGAVDLPLPALPAAQVQTPALSASVVWSSRHSHDTAGAPPNGTDFVRLRAADGRWLKANELRSLTFEGGATYPSEPVEWTVEAAPGDRSGQALASGSGQLLDRSIVRDVTVPAGAPTLAFDTRHQIETGFDVGLVEVSDDGGATWTTLAGDRTRTITDEVALPSVLGKAGLTGDSGGWVRATYDLSAWAGDEVLVRFRYVTDRTVEFPGWWIDDVAVGGTVVADGSTVEGWRSPTQVRPEPVAGWSAQLVAYSSTDEAVSTRLGRMGLSAAAVARPTLAELRPLTRDSRLDVVGVLVTAHDPTERQASYAPYRLTANGVVQPGGG